MAAKFKIVESLGVDAYAPESNAVAPSCQHGPTILFERYFKNKSSRRFFACSASRDRKGCPFFQWEDEKFTTGKQIVQMELDKKLEAERAIADGFHQIKEDAITSKKKMFFCYECGCVYVEDSGDHDEHRTVKLSKTNLYEPSKFLAPAENKKTNAQFFFSESSCSFIVNSLIRLGFEKIVSLGVPRIHEKIQRLKLQKSGKQESILLDLDKRYAQFLSPSEFIHYNMFNNYFFGGEAAEKKFRDFVTGTEPRKVALVMDPPFGALMSLLAASLKKLFHFNQEGTSFDTVATLMIFPYYLESHVAQAFPNLKMTDYKVCYENHPNFKQRSSERGSPIRIYTNISEEDFVLPVKEGYRFCDDCKRYVADQNNHCGKCNLCPSKDGRPYVHCNQCGNCVKPGRVHCSVCQSCELEDHNCEVKKFDSFTCHICGEEGHKRKDCPQKKNRGLKRQNVCKEDIKAKKRKKSHPKHGKKQKK